MTDKIGVLGEQSGLTVGVQTIYTVPAGKAAKGKLFFRCGSGVNTNVDIFINNIAVLSSGVMASGNHFFSIGTDNVVCAAPTATVPNGQTAATTVAPSGATFFLSAGDLVQYQVSTAALSYGLFQFVGVETDVE